MANDWWSQIGGVPTTQPPALPALPQYARDDLQPKQPDPLATLRQLQQQQSAPQIAPLQMGSPNVPQMPMTGGAAQAQNNPVADMAKQYLLGYAFDQAFNPKGGGGGGAAAPAPTLNESLDDSGTGQPTTGETPGVAMGGGGQAAAQVQPQAQPTNTAPGLKDLPKGQPKTKKEWQGFAESVAQQAGFPPDVFVRLIDQESGFDPAASSPAGAKGIAQFMPSTAAGLGIDPMDPQAALAGSAHLLSYYQKKYGSVQAALICYNAGEGRYQQYLNGVPLPKETQDYLRIILGSSS